jgi:formate C-acetyltransferase
VDLGDARDYVPVGCDEAAPVNAWGRCNGGYLNLPKLLELALNDGVCRITGVRAGPSTGDPRTFESFGAVIDAYAAQLRYSMERLVTWDNLIDMNNADLIPTPFTSMLVGGCIEKGKDVTEGGARYNWTSPSGIGIANAGDSLYTIKKLVFEDRSLTMSALLNALQGNFEGEEHLRQRILRKVPKYGNDVLEVDLMVKLVADLFFESMKGFETYRGGPFVASLIPVSSYVAFGMSTGATPDGRKARERLADGISPITGMDLNGPTAVFKSVCRIDHRRCPNGVIFNQKISPGAVSTPDGLRKFAELVRSYVRLGGSHVQFNIISSGMLREAQRHPESHRGLVVRVAGYSAFFNELHSDIQESIIERTEQILK